MKRILAIFLVLVCITGLAACGGGGAQPSEGATVPETTAAPTTQPVETEAEELEGDLYLTVSSINFSLVGESEDIYLGLIPRELVTFESDDPSIVSVEAGVLTANAVGTTTIRATYLDRQVECTAGCLAQTQEELDKLSYDVLSQPKRQLPEVDLSAPITFYDNSALVGDSITYMMMLVCQKEDYLGNLLFLTRGGTSLSGFVSQSKNLYYRGKEMPLEDAIGKSGVERMYILIGSNDIGSPTEKGKFFSRWDTMLERLREKSPDLQIVMISNIPKYGTQLESNKTPLLTYNSDIQEYNEKMKTYCQENGCMYLDLYSYIEDHCGRMAKDYNRDGFHMNDKGNLTWIKVMRYYAQFELEGGNL